MDECPRAGTRRCLRPSLLQPGSCVQSANSPIRRRTGIRRLAGDGEVPAGRVRQLDGSSGDRNPWPRSYAPPPSSPRLLRCAIGPSTPDCSHVAIPDHTPHRPVVCHASMPAPAPEPVAAFVRSSAALTLVPTLRLPATRRRDRTHTICGAGARYAQPVRTLDARTRSRTRGDVGTGGRGPRSGSPHSSTALRHRIGGCTRFASGAARRISGARTGRRVRAVQRRTDVRCTRRPAAHACRHAARAHTERDSRGVPPLDARDGSGCLGSAGGSCRSLRPPSTRKRPAPPRECPRRNSQRSWNPSRRWTNCSSRRRCANAGCPRPAADPVFSYLRTSSAPAINLTPALALPAFRLSRANTFVPRVRRSKTIPTAEAVMAAILPSAANAPLAPIHRNGRQSLCRAFARIPGERLPAATVAACAPPPAAVESWLAAALVTVPLIDQTYGAHWRGTCRASGGLSTRPGALPAGGRSRPGRPGVFPGALGGRRHLQPNTALHLPLFAMSVLRDRAVPIYGARSLTPAVTKPTANPVRLSALKPIDHAGRDLPRGDPPGARADPAAPRPAASRISHPPPAVLPGGPSRVDPFASHTRAAPLPVAAGARRSWKILPRSRNPRVRKASLKSGTCPPPSGRRPLLMAVGRVAAMFLMGVSLWFATASFLGERRLAREVSSGAALSAAANPNPAGANGSAAQHAATGPVARVRQAIADRAALRIARELPRHG